MFSIIIPRLKHSFALRNTCLGARKLKDFVFKNFLGCRLLFLGIHFSIIIIVLYSTEDEQDENQPPEMIVTTEKVEKYLGSIEF